MSGLISSVGHRSLQVITTITSILSPASAAKAAPCPDSGCLPRLTLSAPKPGFYFPKLGHDVFSPKVEALDTPSSCKSAPHDSRGGLMTPAGLDVGRRHGGSLASTLSVEHKRAAIRSILKRPTNNHNDTDTTQDEFRSPRSLRVAIDLDLSSSEGSPPYPLPDSRSPHVLLRRATDRITVVSDLSSETATSPEASGVSQRPASANAGGGSGRKRSVSVPNSRHRRRQSWEGVTQSAKVKLAAGNPPNDLRRKGAVQDLFALVNAMESDDSKASDQSLVLSTGTDTASDPETATLTVQAAQAATSSGLASIGLRSPSPPGSHQARCDKAKAASKANRGSASASDNTLTDSNDEKAAGSSDNTSSSSATPLFYTPDSSPAMRTGMTAGSLRAGVGIRRATAPPVLMVTRC